MRQNLILGRPRGKPLGRFRFRFISVRDAGGLGEPDASLATLATLAASLATLAASLATLAERLATLATLAEAQNTTSGKFWKFRHNSPD